MATKAAARESEANDQTETATDGPLMDSVAAAVKKLIAKGKERGYITIDELNAVMPPDDSASEQIEDVMTLFSEMGVNVIENEDSEEASSTQEGTVATDSRPAGNLNDDDIGRTDDPVRMYLREMGSVELLSREGEIAIAKRIEAGREKMIGALCESPLTMRAIAHWHDALNEGELLLRDVIDLDATYGGDEPDESMLKDDVDLDAEDEKEIVEEVEAKQPNPAKKKPSWKAATKKTSTERNATRTTKTAKRMFRSRRWKWSLNPKSWKPSKTSRRPITNCSVPKTSVSRCCKTARPSRSRPSARTRSINAP